MAGLLGVGLGVAVAEGGLRAAGFEFQLYPTKVQFGWPDPGAMQELYELDETRLWVPKDYAERVAAAVADPPAHVFMGCSCTEFGRYDGAFEEALRSAAPDSAYRFTNLGVGGWTTYQGLQQMREDVVRIKPKIATIYFGWNDHWSTFGIEDKDISAYSMDHSRVLTWLSERMRVAQLVNQVLFEKRFQGSQAPLSSQARVALDDFRANLEGMVALARENGITPVLLTAPTSHQPGDEPVYVTLRWLENKDDLVPLHRAYVDVVREVAATTGVHIVDLFEEFAALDRETLDASFQDDGVHLTDAGNERLGRLLYESLRAAGLVEILR